MSATEFDGDLNDEAYMQISLLASSGDSQKAGDDMQNNDDAVDSNADKTKGAVAVAGSNAGKTKDAVPVSGSSLKATASSDHSHVANEDATTSSGSNHDAIDSNADKTKDAVVAAESSLESTASSDDAHVSNEDATTSNDGNQTGKQRYFTMSDYTKVFAKQNSGRTKIHGSTPAISFVRPRAKMPARGEPQIFVAEGVECDKTKCLLCPGRSGRSNFFQNGNSEFVVLGCIWVRKFVFIFLCCLC